MRRCFTRTAGAGLVVAFLAIAATWGPATAQEEGEDERPARARTIAISGMQGGSYLGVRIEDVNEEDAGRLGLSDVHGVLVSDVVDEGPAAEAGLQEEDVLTEWNGLRLESVAQLRRHLRETPPGRTVRLGVFRDGRQRELSVELGERSGAARLFGLRSGPEVTARLREMEPRMENLRGRLRAMPRGELRVRTPEGRGVYSVFVTGRGRMGVSLQSLSEQLAEYFGVEGGALVTSVHEDSPAEAAGLRAGDVIVEIDGESVEDPGDAGRLIRERDAGPVTVRVMRDGQSRTFTVELEERQGALWCPEGEECPEWDEEWAELGEELAGEWSARAEDFSRHLKDWADTYADEWEEWQAEHAEAWKEWAEEWQDHAEAWKDWAREWEWQHRDRPGYFHIEPGTIEVLGAPEMEPVYVEPVEVETEPVYVEPVEVEIEPLEIEPVEVAPVVVTESEIIDL